MVQDCSSDGIGTVNCSSDGIGIVDCSSDGIGAVVCSGDGIGLNNGGISWIFSVTELVVFRKSDS